MKAYRKRRYKKNTHPEPLNKLIIVGILVLILLVQAIRSADEKQLIHKAETARSQSSLIQAGYIQDEESIRQKEKANVLLKLLVKELGKPYMYGKEGPSSFDCSGLVKYVFSEINIDLPRTACDQAGFGTPVPKDSLRFGDIIFFSMDGEQISHVGIYIGNGHFEHAPKSGEVIGISSLNSEYYKKSFKKAVRLLN